MKTGIMIRKAVALGILLFAVVVVIRESSFHFNSDIVEIKREHRSAQRHWNIGYNQSYVYYDSPLRYEDDLRRIAEIIEPGQAVLSDITTSYYAAATLPVFVFNVHTHHRPKRVEGLGAVLVNFCYLEDQFHRQDALDFLHRDAQLSAKRNWPPLRYVLLNKDKENSLLQRECLTVRSERLESSLLSISELLYEGEYLNVYQLP